MGQNADISCINVLHIRRNNGGFILSGNNTNVCINFRRKVFIRHRLGQQHCRNYDSNNGICVYNNFIGTYAFRYRKNRSTARSNSTCCFNKHFYAWRYYVAIGNCKQQNIVILGRTYSTEMGHARNVKHCRQGNGL